MEQATLIFGIELFLIIDNHTLFYEVLVTLNKSFFPKISFLRIICNVITFPNLQIFFLHLTRKPYPKFCQIFRMGCVVKTSVAHILRSD